MEQAMTIWDVVNRIFNGNLSLTVDEAKQLVLIWPDIRDIRFLTNNFKTPDRLLIIGLNVEFKIEI